MSFDMKPKNFRFLKWGSALFFIFLALLFLATRGIFSSFDPVVTNLFQAEIPRIFDIPLSILTLLGSSEVTFLIVLLIAFLIYRREKRIYWALALFAMIFVFEFVGKIFLYHPGPPINYFRFALPFNLPTSFVQTRYSFPSGHVSRTAFLVVLGLFFFRKKPWVVISCLAFLALMVLSRVYLGEHWTSDVIGGLFLGGAMGMFSLVYY